MMNGQLDGWMHEWIFVLAWKLLGNLFLKFFWKMDEDLDGRMHVCMKGSIDG